MGGIHDVVKTFKGEEGSNVFQFYCILNTLSFFENFFSPFRSSPRKGFSEPFNGPSSFHTPRDSQRTPNARRDRVARRDEDCFGNEIFKAEDFTQEFDFEKNLALFDKRLVFEEISASNQPDVIRLVDINRRKTTPVLELTGSEPKYRNDQVKTQSSKTSK